MNIEELSVAEQILIILKKYQSEGNAATPLALTDPLTSLGIDSIGMAEALFDIEDTFSIVIEERGTNNEEAVEFSTINDLVNIVTQYIEKKA